MAHLTDKPDEKHTTILLSSTGVSPAISSHAKTGIILHLRDGFDERVVPLDHFPFSVGRRPGKDIVLKDASVSRDHASFCCRENICFIEDEGSKHGTFVNSQRINGRIEIHPGDRIQFGPNVHAIVHNNNDRPPVLELLSQIYVPTDNKRSELEKLTLFLEAVRALSSSNVLSDVLNILIESCLALTGAERGFVFLRDTAGEMKLAAGRTNKKQPITSSNSISHSILRDTIESADEFIVSDTTKLSDIADRQSIVTHDLRSVISIPLRMKIQQDHKGHQDCEIRGVLYLDSQFISQDLSKVDHQILRAIANEAAILLENAVLMEAEEARRSYQQELAIAAGIQQGLMPTRIPEVPFARIRARSIACSEIGGDFYDILYINDKLNLVLVDVSGKGVSAALLASILQGLIYSHLLDNRPLQMVASALNQFLCTRDLNGKYATLFIGRISSDGHIEWIRCGHVPPVQVRSDQTIHRWEDGSLPVGLLPFADFTMKTGKLNPGDRLVIISDGVTEAENSDEEQFGDERLEDACHSEDAFSCILEKIAQFRGLTAQNDDATIIEVSYTG
jgi:phosphoserine phosphatase RsbU/P